MTSPTKIHATVTPYEGDDFPEADRYVDYVAAHLADRYPSAEIDVSEGSKNRLFVDGEPDDEGAREFGASLWDAFCEGGYETMMTTKTFACVTLDGRYGRVMSLHASADEAQTVADGHAADVLETCPDAIVYLMYGTAEVDEGTGVGDRVRISA